VSRLRAALPLLLAVALTGCRGCPSGSPPIHLMRNMMFQPKVKPQAESAFFYDGAGMRVPVADTVAQGGLHDDDPAWTGKAAGGAFVTALPLPADDALLSRGEQRFGIYCQPCHGAAADGKGMLYQRAQVQSANLMSARFRAMPVGQLFDEVTHGQGLMPAYGPFVPAHDRWAILAYVRKLQSQTPAPDEASTPGGPAQAGTGGTPPAASENGGLPGQPATPSAQTGSPPVSGGPGVSTGGAGQPPGGGPGGAR